MEERQLLKLALAALVLCVAGSQAQYTPVCDPVDFSPDENMPFPKQPDQFYAVVEANLLEQSSSMVATEYYDTVGNRIKFTITSGEASVQTIIARYNDDELFQIPPMDGTGDCLAVPIGDGGIVRNLFRVGSTIINGSLHIGSIGDSLFSVDSTNNRYLGNNYTARGVPCHRFQTCTSSNEGSFMLDYWLSSSSWDTAYVGSMVPVRVNLTAKRIIQGGNVVDINHVYSFTAFNVGPQAVPDEAFEVPLGLVCKGRAEGKPLPELNSTFSFYSELEDLTSQTPSTFYLKEYYDYPLSLFRIDVSVMGRPYSLVHDFNLEVQYVIDRLFNNCTVSPLYPNNTRFDGNVGEDGYPTLRLANQLFAFDWFNFSYEGETVVREVEVDAWVGYLDFVVFTENVNISDVVYEVFFTKPGFVVSSDYSSTNQPVLWATKATGSSNSFDPMTGNYTNSSFSFIQNYFAFSVSEPPYDTFDTSVCVDPVDYGNIVMRIPDFPPGIEVPGLRRAIRLAVANFANIPALQVGSVMILGQRDSGDLIVTLHISNLTSFARVENRKTANQVLKEISDATLDNGTLPFTIELAPGVLSTPILVHTSVDPPPTPETCPLSTGGAVGLAFGMIALGVLLGVLGTVIVLVVVGCCRKHTGSLDLARPKDTSASAEPYKRHVDESAAEHEHEMAEVGAPVTTAASPTTTGDV